MEVNKIKVLLIGLDEKIKQFISVQFSNYEKLEISSKENFINLIEERKNDNFDLILSGLSLSDLPIIELAQSLKMKFKNKPIFFIGLNSQVQDNSELLKNGFSDCFYYPMDVNLLSVSLHDVEKKITGKSYDSLVAVNISDFNPEENLDFELSLFLPANKKYVKLNNKGDKISSRISNKFASNSLGHLYIRESNLGKYYNFLASKIKGLTKNSPEIQNSVRKLFHDLLSPKSAIFEEGKTYMDCMTEIVSLYIKSPEVLSIQKELLKSIGNEKDGLYERSQKIAAIAGLISLTIGCGRPEDLVTAALFCDVGLTDIDMDIVSKKESELNKEEKEIYYKHIAKTMTILGNKRIVLVPEVRDAIQDHHERFDGKGFPLNKPGFKLSYNAQILSFAVQFEEITRIITGQPRVFPQDAFNLIAKNGSINPDIIIKIKPLFIDPEDYSKAS